MKKSKAKKGTDESEKVEPRPAEEAGTEDQATQLVGQAKQAPGEHLLKRITRGRI